MRRDRALALAAMLLPALWLGAVAAQALPDALQERIGELPAALRERLQQRAATLAAMSPAQRQQFQRRIAEWQALEPEARRRQRERWQAWQALPDGERTRLQAAALAFAALPVQEQLDLRARFAQLDDSARRGWLLGPVLGADWVALQPLLMQVPEAQREPLLQAVRALGSQQRADLGVLAQRTPPPDRDRLRREFLATPAARRGAWLVQQLDR